jgi:hypothetical protein
MITESQLKERLRKIDFNRPDSVKECDLDRLLDDMTLQFP